MVYVNVRQYQTDPKFPSSFSGLFISGSDKNQLSFYIFFLLLRIFNLEFLILPYFQTANPSSDFEA